MPLPLQSGTSFSGTVAWSSYVEMEASCSPGASISMNPEQSSCSFNLDILSLLCLATKIICLFIMLELLDVQTRLRKGRGNRDQIANICCITRRRQWHPTPVLLPGKSHGQRSLVGCSPSGRHVTYHWFQGVGPGHLWGCYSI